MDYAKGLIRWGLIRADGGTPVKTAPFDVVTGGAGFIGSHLVDRLVAEGRIVRVIDNLAVGRRENLRQHQDNKAVELIVADVAVPGGEVPASSDETGISNSGRETWLEALAPMPMYMLPLR